MAGMTDHPPAVGRLFYRPWIIGLVLLAMVAAVHFPLMENLSRGTVPWVHPDNLYFCSVVEWNMQALRSEWPALYHLNVLYPYSYVTFFGHPLFGESLFFLISGQCLKLDLQRTIVLYMFFSFWLGGLGCFLLAREISGRLAVGYLGAFLFILNPFFRQISMQLNIQSFYWSGFILFFLVRLLRRTDWRSGLGLTLFCFLQGLFEIYHGFFVMGITIPLFFVFALAFKAMKKKGARILAVSLLAGVALNVLMYFPFPRVVDAFELQRKNALHFRSLIDGAYLLGPATGTSRGNAAPAAFLVMGCGAMAVFMFGFLRRRKLAAWQWGLLLTAVVSGFLAAAAGWVWGANALLLGLLACFSWLVFRGNPDLPALWKICWAVMLAQLLIFFRFDGLVPGSSFSLYGLIVQLVPMLSGLRFLFRGIYVLVPLFIALLAAAGAAAFDRIRAPRVRWVLIVLVLAALRLGLGYWRTAHAALPLDPAPYQAMEKGRDRVLIEFPFWGTGSIIHHALYSVNTMFHHNYLVNGRVAFRTDAVYDVFRKTATTYAPHPGMLPGLLEKYGVDYMVFHWDLMRKENLKSDGQIAELRSQVVAAADFVSVLADEERYTVLRLKENFPLRVVRRSYSGFHLSRRDVVLELAEPCDKEVRAFLTKKPGIKARVSRPSPRTIRLSFAGGAFDVRGNPIEVHFPEPVSLKDIRLEKK